MSVYSSFRSGVSSLTAGTGTAVSTSTGNVVIWNTSGGGGSIPVAPGDANKILSNNGTNTFWTSTISLNHLTMNGNITAGADETYNIGSITSKWANLFVSNGNNQGLWIGNNIINVSSDGYLLINGQIQGFPIDGGSANTVYSPSEVSIDGGHASSIYPSNELAIDGGNALSSHPSDELAINGGAA